ncbi:MAG TPA: bifunctional DNA-formamidopyrimidine glycosylase/DNA-(apurinic or apyrimidinic site) lyase, partial [Gammaproteobacteria bacterium]|nr:bifunctional DNA-formamidopyrimidine glycosylase/DNA-(apurinic or apyrimidinic site) lyase [Gammaproteobacteria bacterium]
MPELPEVETTLRGITPHIHKKTVRQVNIYQAKLRWPIDKNLPARLIGKKLLDLQRRGKYLIFEFENGNLLLHLGMSGSLRITTSATPREKHDHLEIIFKPDKTLRLRDPRRFGAALWTSDDWKNHKLIRSLGPEPLSNAFGPDDLFKKSRNRSIAVKSFIMDSHTVVGVGNIYASEALFLAKIHPRRASNRIAKKRYEQLTDAIKRVLTKAI